jgi:hypothetical protein
LPGQSKSFRDIVVMETQRRVRAPGAFGKNGHSPQMDGHQEKGFSVPPVPFVVYRNSDLHIYTKQLVYTRPLGVRGLMQEVSQGRKC